MTQYLCCWRVELTESRNPCYVTTKSVYTEQNMLPVPSNTIHKVHGAGVHIMLLFVPPELPQTSLTAPY